MNTFMNVYVAAVALTVGHNFGYALTYTHVMKDAVQHRAAHYDSQTGDFVWNQ